ncbi:sensor histidine kinase [Mesobacillus zeae]|uniref:sensor histidine kinase n=1 Tax=Mesobacillus zeae TaxID=1917180 RepID=UPI002174DA77|nr:sensor histidine kinase [Mesobacillus zeae]
MKIHKLWILSSAFILIIINAILFSSVPINRGVTDILYMDLLAITIQLFTMYYGFIKHKRKYGDIFSDSIETLDKKAANGQDFFIDRVLRASRQQHNRFLEIEEGYKKGINEIQDYTTQWVHDMKVNLAVCDLLLDEMEVGISKEFRSQIEQIKFRVNHILHVTRASHYDQDITAEEVDVCELLRNAIKENALFFINKNIEIETDLKPFNVVSDKKWIYYIFCQILNNSSKYTPDGGTLHLYIREDEKAHYVHIKDNGIGIPKEEITRIFDKGFTGKNGKVGTKSTGMGLYYARKMAGVLSIGMDIKSEEAKYTEFTIVFYKLSDYYHVSSL